jgi:hypothetical protein
MTDRLFPTYVVDLHTSLYAFSLYAIVMFYYRGDAHVQVGRQHHPSLPYLVPVACEFRFPIFTPGGALTQEKLRGRVLLPDLAHVGALRRFAL